MNGIQVVGIDGHDVALDGPALEQLKASLRGALALPGDAGYEKARTVWNAMIDRKPALVVRCAGVADVRQAVTFAHAHRLLTAVKGADTISREMPCATEACSSTCPRCEP